MCGVVNTRLSTAQPLCIGVIVTDDSMSKSDADIDYLYDRAHKAGIGVIEADEDIFLELVGKQYSDGLSSAESRRRAFVNWAEMKRK